MTQRLAWLVLHANRNVGVDHARGGFQRRLPLQFRFDRCPVADQQELHFRMPSQRQRGPGDDNARTDVAPHGVNRDANLAWHEWTTDPCKYRWNGANVPSNWAADNSWSGARN